MKAKIIRKLCLIPGLIAVVLGMETCSTDWLDLTAIYLYSGKCICMYAALTASDALIP